MDHLTDERWAELIETRALRPQLALERLRARRRRPLLTDGRLFIVAADHSARGMLGVPGDAFAMADRRRTLDALMIALAHDGVDGVLASADIMEDLALLGALDDKLAFGTMNRGGIMPVRQWELDDRMTAYRARRPSSDHGLDGGKVLAAARRRRRRHGADPRGLRPGRRRVRSPRPADHGRAAAVPPRSGHRRGQAARRRGRPPPRRGGRLGSRRHLDGDVAEGARRQEPCTHAGDDHAPGVDPRRHAGRRPGGHLRLVGPFDGGPQRSRARRRPVAALPGRRRRQRGPSPAPRRS